MPKIVNREEYRAELAAKAAELFSKHGYKGLGMRGIATELNISKSALYHYFKTKEELFEAATESVMNHEFIYSTSEDVSSMSDRERLKSIVESLDEKFKSEMILMTEYLRDKTPSEVQSDVSMKKYHDLYAAELSEICGEKYEMVWIVIMGGLLQRMLTGNQITVDAIVDMALR